ncbi:MAG: TIM-barrel domain-containing protein [Treponema sp.]
MITRYTFGNVVETNATVELIKSEKDNSKLENIISTSPLTWKYKLSDDDIVYGLGEQMRGMNKRGFKYVSWCSDASNQTESTQSLYGAHNFLIVFGKKTFGIFFDTSSKVTFDIDWTKLNELTVTCYSTGVDVYKITADEKNKSDGSNSSIEESELTNITTQFRKLIGQSYIPPRWAFGFQQSRWGYRNEKDVRYVIEKFMEAKVPLDAICLDIDYMDEYKDFTVDENKFPEMKDFVDEVRKEGVHLIPIIDAGVKIKEGYEVYEEGVKNNYFCKMKDGTDYVAGVWPGRSHFPDFLNSKARKWFGLLYKKLTSLGIDGFWNDMNEPAMFYSEKSLKDVFEKIDSLKNKNLDINSFFDFTPLSNSTFNRLDDYESFNNEAQMKDGSTKVLSHDKVHNIYGASMTRSAGEGLKEISPDKRMLIYSRASCIGAHRYGGIWTGDNCSWWGQLKQEIQMMPSLNMCGFLYSGADIGGFGSDTSRDLVLRWTEFGVFTPLMRNHSAHDTRQQEFYQYENVEDFQSVMNLRYALLPFIYSEFVKCSVNSKMYFRQLSYDYPKDIRAIHIEDELLLGESVLLAPIYEQNSVGRNVYIPEDMVQVTWQNNKATEKNISKGDHYIDVPLNTVVFFVKCGHVVPLCTPALNSEALDTTHFSFVGDGKSYELYEDDGVTRNIDLIKNTRKIYK